MLTVSSHQVYGSRHLGDITQKWMRHRRQIVDVVKPAAQLSGNWRSDVCVGRQQQLIPGDLMMMRLVMFSPSSLPEIVRCERMSHELWFIQNCFQLRSASMSICSISCNDAAQ